MKLTYERILIAKAGESNTPISGSFELLPLCNMNCDMCYVRLDRKEMEQQGRLRTADEWIELAEQMQKAGTLFLLLTGGEPLLYPEFKKVYLGLRKLGMIVTINTNGTLIDETWADFFEAYPPRRINITLYGVNEETYRDLCHYPGGYKKTIRGIELLRERGIDVKINGSLVRDNENDVMKIVDIAAKLNAAVNIDTYMYPAVRERTKPFNEQSRLLPEIAARGKATFMKVTNESEQYRQIAKEVVETFHETLEGESTPNKMRCQAGKTSFTINWQGKMRPCVMLTKPEIEVFEVGFKTAWLQLQEGIRQISLSPRCSACIYRRVCQTCAACALYEAGAYNAVPEYMCRYTRAFVNEMEQVIKNDENYTK